MKKILLLSACLLFAFAQANATQFFVGVKGGIGDNDDNVKNAFSGSYKYSDDKSILGAEAGFDFDTKKDTTTVGIKVGFNSYGKVDSTDKSVDKDILLKNAVAVPLTIYIKYAPEPTGFHFWLGGGMTWSSVKFQDDVHSLSDTKDQIYPHVAAGAEWRPTTYLGVGLDLKYNINAKIETNDIYRDFTGPEAMLAVRLYI
ncbi:opacity protein-like surface antigen [Elusimicrobium posterum]|uniref:outer membrane beta-barrel protein n=1 Tax=Elusimicrobium posterum TaxID=3116653 RepID=UPI003C761203